VSSYVRNPKSRAQPIVQLTNVGIRFGERFGIHRITLEVERGEFIYILGKSGAGKTTLLRTIFMDLLPAEGHLSINGWDSLYIRKRDIPYMRRKMGMVFQDFMLLEDRTTFENVALPLEVTGAKKHEVRNRVFRSLADVGLSHKNTQFPQHLSGGEKQRVGIARAIVAQPLIVLADEPTGNLDPHTAEEIILVLQKINSKGTAVLIATHNYNLIKKFPGRILRLHKGRLDDSQELPMENKTFDMFS